MLFPRRRRCGNAEDIKKTQKDRKISAPRKHPRVHPRALSNPRSGEPIHSWNPFSKRIQQTFDQSQSPLFQLPEEIRLQIWFEFLGGRLLHIARAPKNLLAVEYVEEWDPELDTGWHWCWGNTHDPLTLGKTPGFYCGPKSPHSSKLANLLPLLQTCRMIYREAIPVLYQSNIFDINHVDTPLYLQRSVLPKHLNRIRNLHFTWDFKDNIEWADDVPYDLGTWRESCNAIASLVGLQSLTMHLTGETDHIPGLGGKDYWAPWLDELVRIKPAMEFRVFLRWPEKDCAEVEKECEYPFKILPTVKKVPPLVEFDTGVI